MRGTTLARTLARSRRRTPTRRSADEFFDELAQREHEPLLDKAKGAARFEVVDGKQTARWLVTIDKGRISVSRRNAHADTVVRTSKESFERAAAGRLNLMAAVLRGEVGVSGDPRMLVMLQRLFPRPGDGR
jgi:putative sterol carrier protein